MDEPLSVTPFRVPLRMPFRGMTYREGLLVHGPAGWGEFAPLPGDNDTEIRRSMDAAEEAAFTPWPPAVRSSVPVNVTVPAVDPQMAGALVRGSGCRTAKVKVAEPGQGLDEDLDRLAAVRDALGPRGHLRIDANGGWSVEQAVDAIRSLARFGLQYVEQPCARLADVAAVRRRVDVPVAVDESIREATDPERVLAAGAADVLVLKVAPLGGVWPTLALVQRCGLPVVVSSALETSVGLSAGVALAAALPELPYACGLGTGGLLGRDVVADPLLPVDGAIPVRRPTPATPAGPPPLVAAPWMILAARRWPALSTGAELR